jgi:hypothetical protein
MSTADKWLIAGTFIGPILGALAATGLISGVLRLARARGQRVEHVAASGADLYLHGVPLTEAQFREAFSALQAELDQLPPPAERSEWNEKRGYDAINRFSMLAGTFPQAFPLLGDIDQAYDWYANNNQYATRNLPRRHGFPLRQ